MAWLNPLEQFPQQIVKQPKHTKCKMSLKDLMVISKIECHPLQDG